MLNRSGPSSEHINFPDDGRAAKESTSTPSSPVSADSGAIRGTTIAAPLEQVLRRVHHNHLRDTLSTARYHSVTTSCQVGKGVR